MLNKAKFQAHPYHLVTVSPWPLIMSWGLLCLTATAVIWFHNRGGILCLGSLLSVFFLIYLWFRDVSQEGTYNGDHTHAVQRGLNLGVILFIVSEAFFFLSIFWAFFHSALSPNVELGSSWPPFGIEALDPLSVPLLNTVLLLSSGSAVTFSHHSLLNKDRYNTLLGLFLTLVLAIWFTAIQGIEYYDAPFNISDSVFGTTFFFSTGFHGLHVIIGTAFLSVALIRIFNYIATNLHHFNLEFAILYWHFVDVVWLFLYAFVYWWGS
jgi:cytochrome c oxidase subunit 3